MANEVTLWDAYHRVRRFNPVLCVDRNYNSLQS